MKLAVVGATGMVGNVMLRVLEERNFPFDELIVCGSEKSVGKMLYCKGRPTMCLSLNDAIAQKPDIVIFSAGGSVSKEYAPKFAAYGAKVIDNSSAFRMDENVPLVVSEVNFDAVKEGSNIIANPNCSTMQLVVALAKVHKEYELGRLVISTYQSVTGTGVAAVDQLFAEREGRAAEMVYPHPIDLNCLPHGGDFEEDGYTAEETKLVKETRKIFNDDTINITATVVRVPVIGGHSMSVNVYTNKPFEMDDLKRVFAETEGVIVQDDPKNNLYPMPITAKDKDAVFVGRIREDYSYPNSFNIWVVSDNLRKGAATNAVQIAERLI